MGTRMLGLRPRQVSRIGLLLLVAAAFVFRLAPLGRYVTPDEPAWVERSVRFADALADGDWASVPSTGHPGVTTMWLGSAGLIVRRWLSPAESAAHLDWIRRLAWLAPENGEAFPHLAFFLPCGRVAVALVTSLSLLAVYAFLERLVNRESALLAVGLLAFEPFLVGHSGLLHTDALLTTFSLLSVLSLLVTVRDGQKADVWALVSGATAGFALLTKSLGAYLILFSGVVLGLSWLLGPMRLSQALRRFLLWGLAGSILYVGLYPAMWVNPLGTARDLVTAPAYQSTTAMMPTFFAGRTALQHGPEFYAVALPLRLGPVVLIGALLGIWTLATRKPGRRQLVSLGVFSLGYVVILALSVKRYQRYLLPAVGALTVMAALSLSGLWPARLRRRRFGPSSLIVVQLLLLLPFAAHPLTSLNPLLGGPWVGARLLSTDWGEGMGAAARWLNRRSDAESLTVAASSVPSFASLFVGRTVPLDQAARADYVVREVPQGRARSLDGPVAYTATVGFVDHAVILTNTAPLEQAAYLAGHVAPGDLILLDADTPLRHRYSGPATLLSAHRLGDEAELADWLARQVPGHDAVWLVASPGASPVTAQHLRRQLEAIATPLSTTTVASSMITRLVPESTAQAAKPAGYRATFGSQLALVDGAIPESLAWPQPLEVTLRWRALPALGTDHRALVALRSGDGHAWASSETLVRNEVDFPTSAWRAGEWADATYSLELPPGTPPDRYSVEVSLYDGITGARLGSLGPDGAFQGTRVPVGNVAIAPPERSPGTAAFDINQGLNVPAGPLKLIGMAPVPGQVLSGDFLSLELFWQAEAVAEADYRVRLRLDGSHGDSGLEFTFPLSAYPTSRWRLGDRFRSHYGLHISPSLRAGDWQLMLNVLDQEGGPLWEQDRALATVSVAPRERAFTLPGDIPHHLDVSFGDVIHLRGFALATTLVRPGETIPLTLYWQADGPTERSYTLFVHLLGPDGELEGQVDRIPGGGAAPTSSWAEGQVTVEEIGLPVASDAQPGQYRVAVGFYDAAYGERLPVAGAPGQASAQNRAVLPLEVEVVR